MAKQYSSQPELTIELDKSYAAEFDTNHGAITIVLKPERSPLAVNNFVFLARDGYYNGVVFHRVVPGFVIQGGDPAGTGRGGPGYKFRDEIEGAGSYKRGIVAMANAGPNTNGSQFFICLTDVGLPHSYSIFGEVTAGMDAVDSIAGLQTKSERPVEDVIINSVTISEA